ncbi:MAG: aspartate--tRNA ligase [Candidatus Wildermuthbacteria bacterium]|nr:aspartate--tRNA ligase [Candidatus Wildermuthbacteria bacterium]
MKRIFTNETPSHKGEKVKIAGWIDGRRDHGKITFIDLRDKEGVAQCVSTPQQAETYKTAQALRSEWVVEIEGTVQERPQAMKNPAIATGEIEIAAEKIVIFSQAKTLPFTIDTNGYDLNEEKRLQYRYLDLRRKRLKENLTKRHTVFGFVREFLSNEGFIEIETPLLTKSTPEGARDFVVPSRLYAGKFYALPQSPQQYKQLLQVAGFERYFQFARCLRDEDPRADRQPEFTQLDLEMSFVEREDVMELNEQLLIALVKKLYPKKEIQEIPFPQLLYKDVIQKYGTDRPDLRKDKNNPDLLAFCWVIDFPFFEKDKETNGWTFTHNPFSAPKPEYMNDLMAKRNIAEILTSQYDVVLNGMEIGGGSIRNHQPEALEQVFEIMGYEKERIQANFGHMLEAFSYGAPPHGGIAWGFDRLMSLLQSEQSIREVIAFPKTGDSRDLLMQSPSEISEQQLKELHLKIETKSQKKS